MPADAGPAPASTVVIFGAYGDLTKRLLMPALHNLAREGLLPDDFAILGVDRVEADEPGFREHLTKAAGEIAEAGGAPLDQDSWNWLCGRIGYLSGDFADPATFERVGALLAEREKAHGQSNAVFYLAVAARFFGPIAEQLGTAGLLAEGERSFRRLVVEKPFGSDLASAKALNARILKVLEERQMFRIDHFLGKETVQNVMALRFGNGIFEPIWNREFIDHVQITAAETVTVETRGHFYDATGALRDMVPNHMFQLLAMVAMEPPNSFGADPVRSEKAKVIEAIERPDPHLAAAMAVRAQYAPGQIQGRSVPAYRQEADVAPDSRTESYVALRYTIDNWRWSGVPFFVRTGKALAARRTEIAIQFKKAPGSLFRSLTDGLDPNMLVIHVQPDEGISMRFAAKVPGRRVRLSEVRMDFRYSDYFRAEPSTGYETLIYDCLVGDATLFQRADNIEAGWAAVQPVLDAWTSGRQEIHHYFAGTDGPTAADELIGRDGFSWLPIGRDRL
ncbi:glucose-6-phosphate dehydrogenase [Geminicoccus roseus]|uniref:glucose-6-phosphate dehydrogenase n=1 Tax=Geminicoccus roseus TaxID=404900 RepID=UPI001969F13F|nr:glucose-6-phosphate dehydrogenase [Geminicoccus roseus]